MKGGRKINKTGLKVKNQQKKNISYKNLNKKYSKRMFSSPQECSSMTSFEKILKLYDFLFSTLVKGDQGVWISLRPWPARMYGQHIVRIREK